MYDKRKMQHALQQYNAFILGRPSAKHQIPSGYCTKNVETEMNKYKLLCFACLEFICKHTVCSFILFNDVDLWTIQMEFMFILLFLVYEVCVRMCAMYTVVK